jgi:hypothetical protein
MQRFTGRPDTQVESIGRSPRVRWLQSKRTDVCHASLFKCRTSISNGRELVQVTVNRLTGRAERMTGHWSTWRPVVSREVFSRSNSDRTRPLGRNRTHPSVRSTQTLATHWRHLNRTLTQRVRSLAPDAQVRAPIVRPRLELTWRARVRPVTPRPASSQWEMGISLLRIHPSLSLKLHLLHKCANITKCTSPCACVLIFSAIILKELG